MTSYRVAVDVGGTFTDLVVAGPDIGERTYKTSSTPSDPASGVLNGLAMVAKDLGLKVEELLAATQAIVHGTTITTNALLTGTGAKTGLLATEGFRDVLQLRQGHRERQWDSKYSQPALLVPRERVRTVNGRINRNGQQAQPLDDAAVRVAAQAFSDEGVEAVAVCLLFSFLNPAHEQRVAEILADELPEAFVSLSFDIAPQIRLFERTSTAVVNAYVGPVLQKYLADLRARLTAHGFEGTLQVMQSNGGLSSAQQVAKEAVTTLLSGPAGGPIASHRLSAPLGIPKTMTIDMGGTSFEASLARGGDTEVRAGGHLAGYALAMAMLDISTIGAGGGSISWIDAGGKLRVGPQSAGAEPGPACYGRGGTEATVTDANLLLGYVGSESFGGGEFTLDLDSAKAAVAGVAGKLGIGLYEAAAGIVATINGSMADSLRLMTVRRGMDVREFALVAAGGAGPLHAAALADDLEVPLVVVPRDASVFCAAGILVTNFKHHYVRTMFQRSIDPDDIERTFATLEQAAITQLKLDGVSESDIAFGRVAQVRYVGQIHTIDMTLPDGKPFTEKTPELVRADFGPEHLQRFGHSLDSPIEIVNIRLEARGSAWQAQQSHTELEASSGDPAPYRNRDAWFDGAFVSTPVFDAASLRPGAVLTGPALVELSTSTVVVPPNQTLSVDRSGAFLLHQSSRQLHAVVDQLNSGGTSV